MALLRLIHAADLPDPSALAAMLAGGGGMSRRAAIARRRQPAASSPNPASRPISPTLVERRRTAGQAIAGVSSCTTRSGWSALRPASWC